MPFNFTMTRGDNATLTLTVTQNGAAFNLTGCSIRMVAKRAYSDADGSAVFVRTVGSGITITDATNGIASITIAPNNTSGLPRGYRTILVYDVQVTTGTGSVFTVIDGELVVKPDVAETTP
jgi:hypothetical protein